MSAMQVGDTIKITGANRHPDADRLLVEHVDLAGARILDIGASDGSTSVDLIAALPTFAEYVLADLYFHLRAARTEHHVVFFDHEGTAILVVGRRLVSWPTRARWVAAMYRRVLAAATLVPTEPVLLLNPDARALVDRDSRVSYRQHDIFTPWPGSPPTIIKVANLLRRLYFPDVDIVRALRVLIDELPEGGYLLMVDNHRVMGLPPRGGLYRKVGSRFTPVADTGHQPEIHDLIVGVAAS